MDILDPNRSDGVMNRDSPEVSLVIPVFNEALVIPKLFEETKAALSKITESFEVILVDDGSTDDSVAIMQQLREQEEGQGDRNAKR